MAMEKSHVLTILVIATLAVVGTTAVALLSTFKTISSNGNVKTIRVGAYKDAACNQTLSTIDWGTLIPGSTCNYTTLYIRNEGTASLVLNETVGNWNPALASSYITLSWNREGYVLSSGATVQAVLTLSVPSNITGISSFSFDITITGTEST
jgi:hypothetical protein